MFPLTVLILINKAESEHGTEHCPVPYAILNIIAFNTWHGMDLG